MLVVKKGCGAAPLPLGVALAVGLPILVKDLFLKNSYFKDQCCGAGAGGAEIIWDLEPEPKFSFK